MRINTNGWEGVLRRLVLGSAPILSFFHQSLVDSLMATSWSLTLLQQRIFTVRDGLTQFEQCISVTYGLFVNYV